MHYRNLVSVSCGLLILGGCSNSTSLQDLEGFVRDHRKLPISNEVREPTSPPTTELQAEKPGREVERLDERLPRSLDDICILVDKSQRRLGVYTSADCSQTNQPPIFTSKVITGGMAEDFHTGELRNHPTPSGTYYISMLGGDGETQPSWIDPKTLNPHKGVYGDYWFPLQSTTEPVSTHRPSPPDYTMLGIHGTTKRGDARFANGQYVSQASHGCIRVQDEQGLMKTVLSAVENPSGYKDVYKRGPVRFFNETIQVKVRE